MTLASETNALAARIAEEIVAVRSEITPIVFLTQTAYDALGTPVTGTLYIIIPE